MLSKLNSRQKSLERLRVGNWTLSLRGKGGWDRDMVVRFSFRDREIQFQGGGNGSTALHFLGELLLWVLGGTARIKGHTIPGVIRVPSEDEYVQKFYQTTFSSSQSVGHSVLKRDVAASELQNFETCFTRGGDRVLPFQLFKICSKADSA